MSELFRKFAGYLDPKYANGDTEAEIDVGDLHLLLKEYAALEAELAGHAKATAQYQALAGEAATAIVSLQARIAALEALLKEACALLEENHTSMQLCPDSDHEFINRVNAALASKGEPPFVSKSQQKRFAAMGKKDKP